MPSSERAWLIDAASVRGPKHVHEGAPNQDSYAACRSKDGESAAIAVSDGAGSSAHSGSMARLIASQIAIGLVDLYEFGQFGTDSEENREKAIDLVDRTRSQSIAAQDAAAEIGDFHCTLTACLVAPQGALFIQIGDSISIRGAVRINQGVPKSQLLDLVDCRSIAPHRGEFAGETRFVTEANWHQYLVVEHSPVVPDFVALMSDGAALLALEDSKPAPGFLSVLLRWMADSGLDESREIEQALTGERVDQQVSDDRTLAILLRRDIADKVRSASAAAPPAPSAGISQSAPSSPAPSQVLAPPPVLAPAGSPTQSLPKVQIIGNSALFGSNRARNRKRRYGRGAPVAAAISAAVLFVGGPWAWREFVREDNKEHRVSQERVSAARDTRPSVKEPLVVKAAENLQAPSKKVGPDAAGPPSGPVGQSDHKSAADSEKSVLRIEIEPTQAKLLIDKKPADPRGSHTITTGKHGIRVTAQGYETFSRKLDVKKGTQQYRLLMCPKRKVPSARVEIKWKLTEKEECHEGDDLACKDWMKSQVDELGKKFCASRLQGSRLEDPGKAEPHCSGYPPMGCWLTISNTACVSGPDVAEESQPNCGELQVLEAFAETPK